MFLLSSVRGAGAEHGNIAPDGSVITNSGGGGVITARPLSSNEKHIEGISSAVDRVNATDRPKLRKGHAKLGVVLTGDVAPRMSPERLAEELFTALTCANLAISLWCLPR